jgi:cell wall assembly regulator SMI1
VSAYDHLEAELALAAPAEPGSVDQMRQEFGPQLPDEYLAFLTAHDGAEGAVGVLAPAAEVGRADDLYPALDHLAGLVIFGSDGG